MTFLRKVWRSCVSRWCVFNYTKLVERILGKRLNSLDDLLTAWNLLFEIQGRLGSKVEKESDRVHVIFTECGCPFVQRKLLKPSPNHCLCSKAYLEILFKKFLGKRVEVEMKKAIGKGDDVCEFYIYTGEKKSDPF